MEQLKMRNSLEFSPVGSNFKVSNDVGGHEYLWQMTRNTGVCHSFFFSPLSAGLWNGKYRTDGKEYAMGRHGFALRDTEFELIYKTQNKVTFALYRLGGR